MEEDYLTVNEISKQRLSEFRKLTEDLSGKIENLLFVIWIQNQRHDYWMKFIKEVREAIQTLREGLEDGRETMVEFKGSLQASKDIDTDTLQTPEGKVSATSTPIERDMEIQPD